MARYIRRFHGSAARALYPKRGLNTANVSENART
jgi:hypothetical protein